MDAASVTGSVNADGVTLDATFASDIASCSLTMNDSILNGTMTFNTNGYLDIIDGQMNYGRFNSGALLVTSNINISTTAILANLSIEIDNTVIQVGSNVNFSQCTSVTGLISAVTEAISANSVDIITAMKNKPSLWVSCVANHIIDRSQISAQFATTVLNWLGVPTSQLSRYLADMQSAIGYTASEVASALKTVLNLTTSAAGKILYEISGFIPNVTSFLPAGIATALQTAYAATEKEIAKAFHDMGLGVEDTAKALVNALGVTAKEAGKLMHAAGYAASEIESVFKSIGGEFAKAASKVRHYLNPTNW